MDNCVLIVLGMLFSSSQGDMGIPNCNVTNSTGHLQDPCCLEECNDTLEQTICEYECPKDMFLSHNMLWDKNGGYPCRHGCRQTCPDNYDGIRVNDVQMCVECFILCRLETLHTSCKCQIEKIENEDSSLGAKDYIIIALALVVVLVMVGCYWKGKRNKDNTKTTENIEKQLQDNSIKDNGNIQETTNETELVDDIPKTIAKEAQRKLDEKTRYAKDPTESVVHTREKHQSTNRIESATYGNAETIGLNRKLLNRISGVFGQLVQRLRSTPDPSGGKGEDMAESGKSNNTSSTSNAHLASTSDTQEHIYGINEDLGNQTREHVPDGEVLYENVRNDNGENGNQVDTDSDTASYATARDSASSTESSVKTSASSTESSVETRAAQKTVHDEINASQSGNHFYINVNNMALNIETKD